MSKTYPYPIRLSDEEKEKLKALADSEYRTMADWIRSRIHIEFERLPNDVQAKANLSAAS